MVADTPRSSTVRPPPFPRVTDGHTDTLLRSGVSVYVTGTWMFCSAVRCFLTAAATAAMESWARVSISTL